MSGTATPVIAFLCFVASFVASGILTRVGLLPDRPNSRSLHTQVTPRSGGLAFQLPALIVLVFIWFNHPAHWVLPVLIGCIAFLALGLLDDAFQLSPLVRLAVQVIVSTSLAYSAGPITIAIFDFIILSGPAAIAFQVIWVMVCINFFNFMDGMDGLAGLQAISFFAAAGFILVQMGPVPDMGRFMICVATGVAGFWIRNLKPSTLFMGDSGSYFCGFLIGFLPLIWHGHEDPGPLIRFDGQRLSNGVDFTLGIILFGPFLLDAGLTILRRLSERQNVFAPHRKHLYQTLRLSGWSVYQVLSVYGFAMVLATAIAVARLCVSISSDRLTAAAILLIVGLGFIYSAAVNRLARERSDSSGSSNPEY
ncbi:MAG: glycosyltransferase family 4 protein [Spirochaetia bacterium]|nr:glycosyltransferase family 4 protein [Spirochaetia bacterium]